MLVFTGTDLVPHLRANAPGVLPTLLLRRALHQHPPGRILAVEMEKLLPPSLVVGAEDCLIRALLSMPKAADKLLAVPLTRLQGLPAFSQLAIVAKMVIVDSSMKFMSAKDAKNEFGLLLDTARAEPVTIEKHGRPVVVVLAVEAFGRLTAREVPEKMVSLPRRAGKAAKRKLTT